MRLLSKFKQLIHNRFDGPWGHEISTGSGVVLQRGYVPLCHQFVFLLLKYLVSEPMGRCRRMLRARPSRHGRLISTVGDGAEAGDVGTGHRDNGILEGPELARAKRNPAARLNFSFTISSFPLAVRDKLKRFLIIFERRSRAFRQGPGPPAQGSLLYMGSLNRRNL